MEIIDNILVIDCGKDPWELTKEELAYVPKPLLLRHWGDCLPYLWGKLPEHIQRDPEIAPYQLCTEHWTPQQVHIERYPPSKSDCKKCPENELATTLTSISTDV